MIVLTILMLLQLGALALLVARLLPGRTRRPPPEPRLEGDDSTSVSVLVPTFNEARRLGPCLHGLLAQGPPLREVIVVDSGSTDGTAQLVLEAAQHDSRIRLTTDPPLPPGWVGKVWALQHGFSLARSEWILGVDADTIPRPGMVAAVVTAARQGGYDVVSFSPRFNGMTKGEQWLQPSMLLTLVYRFGAAGARVPPDRVLANGQCFLARRELLASHGAYESARTSWADDVTLARSLARSGARVAFLDGARLYDVRAYDSLGQMWREWGRSFDLRDATPALRQWLDVTFIWLVQGLPLAVLAGAAVGIVESPLALGVNAVLFVTRILMQFAIRGSYAHRSMGYWLSPLSDPVAAFRLALSTWSRPTSWRGRAPQLTPLSR